MKNQEGVVRTIQSTGERPPRHVHNQRLNP